MRIRYLATRPAAAPRPLIRVATVLLVALAVMSTALTLSSPPAEAQSGAGGGCEASDAFTDVPEHAYYTAAIKWAACSGITNGTSATTFSPDDTVTRAQMATFLWRFAGEPTGNAHSFVDVSPGSYYDKPVGWLLKAGITGGTSATTFSPDNPVTRAQMATFLWRFVDRPATPMSAPFTDVPAGKYYTEPVAWMYANGISNGTSTTTFSPGAALNRAQAVTFLWRLETSGITCLGKLVTHSLTANGTNNAPADAVVFGTPGDDVIQVTYPRQTICSGPGNDRVLLYGSDATVDLGSGNDVAVGVIATGAGNLIYGGFGDDKLNFEEAHQYVEAHGGPGNDTILAGPSGLLAFGGAGNDTLTGHSGSDRLHGGDGNDTLHGGPNNDFLYGGNGNDGINGGNADDTIEGNAGDDNLWGKRGYDTIDGGAGNDRLWGGRDQDTLSGGIGNDVIDGESGFDILNGGPGNDSLNGGTENDTLNGEAGDDSLDGGPGTDSLNGGPGTDNCQEPGDSCETGPGTLPPPTPTPAAPTVSCSTTSTPYCPRWNPGAQLGISQLDQFGFHLDWTGLADPNTTADAYELVVTLDDWSEAKLFTSLGETIWRVYQFEGGRGPAVGDVVNVKVYTMERFGVRSSALEMNVTIPPLPKPDIAPRGTTPRPEPTPAPTPTPVDTGTSEDPDIGSDADDPSYPSDTTFTVLNPADVSSSEVPGWDCSNAGFEEARSPTEFALQWQNHPISTDSVASTVYEVDRGSLRRFAVDTPDRAPATDRVFVSGLKPSTYFVVVLEASNRSGASLGGCEVVFTTSSTTTDSDPTFNPCSTRASFDAGTAAIGWNRIQGAALYTITLTQVGGRANSHEYLAPGGSIQLDIRPPVERGYSYKTALVVSNATGQTISACTTQAHYSCEFDEGSSAPLVIGDIPYNVVLSDAMLAEQQPTAGASQPSSLASGCDASDASVYAGYQTVCRGASSAFTNAVDEYLAGNDDAVDDVRRIFAVGTVACEALQEPYGWVPTDSMNSAALADSSCARMNPTTRSMSYSSAKEWAAENQGALSIRAKRCWEWDALFEGWATSPGAGFHSGGK